uniref:Uncharacterized protein n=1 Tax=Dulem virus 42 TaxID=3145760 RepID=A0AAU8B9B1_9CAUD
MDENPEMAHMVEVFGEKYGLFSEEWKRARQADVQAIVNKLKTNYKNDLDFREWYRVNYDITADDLNDIAVPLEDFQEYARWRYISDKFNITNSESFANNPFIRSAAKEILGIENAKELKQHLKDTYENDKDIVKQITDRAGDMYMEGNMTKEQYLRSYVHLFHLYTKIRMTQKALARAKDQQMRLSAIRKYSG